MPHPFNVTVTPSGSGQPESLKGEFPDEDWSLLEEYLECSWRLAKCRFAQTSSQGKFKLHWKQGEPVQHEVTLPPEDDIFAFLHLMRPFVLQRERANFYRICKILARHIALAAFRQHLDVLRRRYSGQGIGFHIAVGSLELTAEAALDKWLYAFEYHRDVDKQAELRALFEVFPESSARFLFLCSMLERAAAIGKVGAIIDGLKKREGHAQDVSS